jgi:hypothetical protein
MGLARPIQAFCTSFANDWSTTNGRYVTINVANESLMSFLAVLKSFQVCVCKRLENTLISYHQNNLK